MIKVFSFSYNNDNEKWGLWEINLKRLSSSSQPFFADFNGDFLPDILHMSEEKLKIAFQTKNPTEYSVWSFEEFVLPEYKGTKCLAEGILPKQLSTPGTVAYGDLDGDCIPDLLMIVKDKGYDYLEIYHQIPWD